MKSGASDSVIIINNPIYLTLDNSTYIAPYNITYGPKIILNDEKDNKAYESLNHSKNNQSSFTNLKKEDLLDKSFDDDRISHAKTRKPSRILLNSIESSLKNLP